MKPSVNNVIMEHEFHPKTVQELATLRSIRLDLTRKQLANVDETMEQLLSRNLIESNDLPELRAELVKELEQRIAHLELRASSFSENDVYFDELAMYVDLI